MRFIAAALLLSTSLAFGQGPCPAAQAQRLATWLASPPNPVPPEKQKPVATRAQLDEVCIAGGQRAYLVAKGVLPPQVNEGTLPKANESMRVATAGGENWVMLRVSAQGRVTGAYLISEQHNLAQEITSEFKGWRLTPAKFKGVPVPVVFKLRLDFKE